jgi:hypothetical protein
MRAFRQHLLTCTLGGGLLILGSAVPIGAAAGTIAAKPPATFEKMPSSAPVVAAKHAAPLTAPRGYKVITAGPFSAPGGQQTQGVASCPGTEVPAGGGALLSPLGDNNVPLYASLNSSYPQRNLWIVDVNTVSGSDASFNVYVNCINVAASYSVVSSALATNPAGTVTSVSVTCPTNRVVVGGGAFSTSSDPAVNITSNFPEQNGTVWRADIANGSTANTTMAAYAICRNKPAGYNTQFSIQSSPSGAETPGSVACAPASLPLSGGDFTGAVLPLSINSTFPTGPDWVLFLNNGDSQSWPFEVFVVCAGT